MQTGGTIVQALVSGQAQMAFGDTSLTIGSIANGAPVQLVANLMPEPLEWGIFVLGNSSYKSLQDLHGANFGATSAGATSSYITQYVLAKQLGWQVGTDYSMRYLGSFNAENAAMLTGSLKAQAESVVSEYSYMVSGQLRSIYNFSLGYPAVSLYASTTFIQQHPDAVLATIEAFLAAGEMWNRNSTLALNILQSQFNLPPEAAQFNYQAITYSTDGAISLTKNQLVVDFMYGSGQIKQNMTVSSFVAHGFVPITY